MWPGYQVVEVNRVGEDWVDFLGFCGQFARWPAVDVDGDAGHP